MSTIKVNRIENTSTTDGGIDVDTSGHVTIDGQQFPTAGPLSNRNKIINGDMRIDQRNAGATITGGTGGYSVDRWNSAFAASGKFNYGQSTTAPAGFTHSLLHTVAAAHTAAAGDYMLLQHYIEGFNVADLEFGTAAALSVTISFWVRSSVTGTYSVAIANGNDNRAYITTFVVNSADTFEYKSVTIPGDTTGTWLKDNNKGVSLKFDLGSGSNYVGASTNTWLGTNTFKASGSVSLVANAGATFYITGVQLEVGSKATPFEHRSYGDELQRCLRYFFKPDCEGDAKQKMMGISYTANTYYISFELPVPMRVGPTVPADGGGNWRSRTNNVNAFAVTWSTHGTATTRNVMISTTGGSIAAATPFWFETHDSSGCSLEFDAEL